MSELLTDLQNACDWGCTCGQCKALLLQAADLIESQIREIAELKDKLSERYEKEEE